MTEITNKTDNEILCIVRKIISRMIEHYSEAYLWEMTRRNGEKWEDLAKEEENKIRDILCEIEKQNRPILKAQLEAIIQVL